MVIATEVSNILSTIHRPKFVRKSNESLIQACQQETTIHQPCSPSEVRERPAKIVVSHLLPQ